MHIIIIPTNLYIFKRNIKYLADNLRILSNELLIMVTLDCMLRLIITYDVYLSDMI